MKLVYPAVFTPCIEKEGYTVEVPDLPGCVTEGKDLVDAIEMGVDAASGWVLGELEEGNNIPASTLAQNICKEIKDKYGNYKTPAIILMHDCMTKTTTVEALSEIIKFLKNESYTFKTLK